MKRLIVISVDDERQKLVFEWSHVFEWRSVADRRKLVKAMIRALIKELKNFN